MAMETNFCMLRKLKKNFKPLQKGFLSGDEVQTVRTTLNISDMDILQLRNLRDFTVLLFSSDKDENNMDIMSGITSVIDQEIYMKGGEV